MKDCPRRIFDITAAKPGKQWSVKVICKVKDIFTRKVNECIFHAGDMIDAPIVNREEYTFLNIDDTLLELLGRRIIEWNCKENQRYFQRWIERVFGFSFQDYGTRANY